MLLTFCHQIARWAKGAQQLGATERPPSSVRCIVAPNTHFKPKKSWRTSNNTFTVSVFTPQRSNCIKYWGFENVVIPNIISKVAQWGSRLSWLFRVHIFSAGSCTARVSSKQFQSMWRKKEGRRGWRLFEYKRRRCSLPTKTSPVLGIATLCAPKLCHTFFFFFCVVNCWKQESKTWPCRSSASFPPPLLLFV